MSSENEHRATDCSVKVDAHRNEDGRKEVDAKFHMKAAPAGVEPATESHHHHDKDKKRESEHSSGDKSPRGEHEHRGREHERSEHHSERKHEGHHSSSRESHDSKHSSARERRHSSEHDRDSHKHEEPNPAAIPGKTPKDMDLRFKVHADEAGKKTVDAKFHFEGKRDHLDDDKDDADKKGGSGGKGGDQDEEGGHKREKLLELVQTAAMAAAEKGEEGPAGMVGAAVTAVGQQIAGGGRSEEEMREFREKGGIKGMIKEKVGEKLYEKGEGLKTGHAGEVVRTVPKAIEFHKAHAEHYHREALIQEELSKNENLKRADRKAAKKKARELFEMEKVELSRAAAEERLLVAPVKVETLDSHACEKHEHDMSHDEKLLRERAARSDQPHTGGMVHTTAAH
jgi:hypothetical protein